MNKLFFYRNCFKQVAVLLDLVTVDKKKKKKKIVAKSAFLALKYVSSDQPYWLGALRNDFKKIKNVFETFSKKWVSRYF